MEKKGPQIRKMAAISGLVGFSGKMGAGKTSAAFFATTFLEGHTAETWQLIAFADELKRLVSGMFGFPMSYCYTDIGKTFELPSCKPLYELTHEDIPRRVSQEVLDGLNGRLSTEIPPGTTVGRVLQIVGQAFRDEIGDDVWIIALEKRMQTGSNYVIEDVRYPNECDFVKRLGGIVGRVILTGSAGRNDSRRDPQHESETAMDLYDKWDFTIETDASTRSYKQLMEAIKKEFVRYF